MAATDSTANNNAGADKKPGADQPADKKAADGAALAKKLHDDSHPAPKPADKPATPAPAGPAASKPADAKPAVVKPAPAEAPKSQGLLGWLSSTEKSASAAISNEANQLKATVKADLKTVNDAASSVLATGEAVVAKGEAAVAKGEAAVANSGAALAKFGTLTITGLAETASHVEKSVKHALASTTDGSKTDKPNEVAGAANKQAQTDTRAVPAAAADSSKAAPEAVTPSGFLASLASAASTAESVIGSAASYVKSEVEDVIGKDTTNALLNVAEQYGGALAFGAAGVLVGEAIIPAMVATAGSAVDYYNKFIGDKTFAASAVKVASVKDATYETSETAARKNIDDAFMSKAASYFLMGDDAPGGAASIARDGDKVTASGTTKDGIDYKTSTTPGKDSATVGAFNLEHTPDKNAISNGDMTVTRTPPLTTLQTKDGLSATYNSDTKEFQVSDHKTGYLYDKNLDGIVTTIGSVEFDQANRGKILAELKKALKTGTKMRLITDTDGNKGFLLADGTSYYLSKADQTAVLQQGDFKLVVYGKQKTVQLFHKNAAGEFVTVDPHTTTLPKGWEIDGNTVKLFGSEIKGTGESVIKLPGAILNTATGFTADTAKGPVSLTSDGKKTKLSAPDGTTVEATPTGATTITQPGRDTISLGSTGMVISDKLTTGTIGTDGSGSLLDLKTGQEADIDPSGNEVAYNAQHQQIFAMNNRGDMTLADGTTISHTGAVVNTARNINEPSYNGKSADEVVREAATQAASVSSYIGGGSGMEASLASLESTLAMLDSLGDVPGLAEQIGAAKGSIQAKIAEVKNKEYLNNLLAQSGKDTSTIEKAFSMRGAGLSDQDIAEKITNPQASAA